MELLLILTYTAICVAIFRIFRIPVNKWTLPTAVLGGIFLIGFILLVMNYNHPFTDNARIYFATTPILPDVRGRVVEVPVEPNRTLKKGDVLFRVEGRLPTGLKSRSGALHSRKPSRTFRSSRPVSTPRRRLSHQLPQNAIGPRLHTTALAKVTKMRALLVAICRSR